MIQVKTRKSVVCMDSHWITGTQKNDGHLDGIPNFQTHPFVWGWCKFITELADWKTHHCCSIPSQKQHLDRKSARFSWLMLVDSILRYRIPIHTHNIKTYTLWLFNIAMANGLIEIDDKIFMTFLRTWRFSGRSHKIPLNQWEFQDPKIEVR